MARQRRASRREKTEAFEEGERAASESSAAVAESMADITMMTLTVATLSPVIQMMMGLATSSTGALKLSANAAANTETLSLSVLSESVKSLLAPPPRVVKVSPPPPPPTAEPLAVS